MKTRYLFFFVLVALVLSAALPVGVVQAAGKTASLVEFKHVHGKGWTAVFQISGNWKAADLKGNTITVGGKTYDLYCNFRDDNHISCTMHHDLGLNVANLPRFSLADKLLAALCRQSKSAIPGWRILIFSANHK
jgi:hypothetical protein